MTEDFANMNAMMGRRAVGDTEIRQEWKISGNRTEHIITPSHPHPKVHIR